MLHIAAIPPLYSTPNCHSVPLSSTSAFKIFLSKRRQHHARQGTFGNNDVGSEQSFSPFALLKPIYKLQTLVIFGIKLHTSPPLLWPGKGL